MQSTHTVRKEVLTDSKEIAGSGLRHGTQPPPCVCSEGHPLDRSQTISLPLRRSPWHQFSKDYSAYCCGFNTMTARYILQAWQRMEMLLADTLSTAYSEDYERSATESEVECIHATHFLPVRDHQLKELQRETACDPILQFVKKAILDGFPVRLMSLPHEKSQTRFKAEIKELADVGSYKVKTEDGRILCRNHTSLQEQRAILQLTT